MAILPENLIKQFAKATNDIMNEKKESFLYGTVRVIDEKIEVLIDGADIYTPCTSSVTVETGDRVVLMIKDRQAVITSNVTNPTINADVLEGRVVKARDKYKIDMIDSSDPDDPKRIEVDAITMSNVYFMDDDENKRTLTIGDEEDSQDIDDNGLEAIQFVNDVYFKKGIAPKDIWISDPEVAGYVWIGSHDVTAGSLYDGHVVHSNYVYANTRSGSPLGYFTNGYGTWHSSSDRRLKHDISDTDESDALSKVNSIKHRKFVWNDSSKSETLGYIAQELEEIDPGAIEQTDDQYYINELHLIALATKAIQELSAKVDFLERRLENLESERNQKLPD